MENRIALAVFSAVMIGFLALVPVAYPEAVSSPWWRVAAISAFILGMAALWWQARLQSREELRTRSLLEQIATSLAVHPNESQNSPLRDRTAQLARDLFSLLKKHGPQPPNPLSVKGGEEEQTRAFDTHFGWKRKLYRDYMAYHRDDVVKIDRELAAHGVITNLEMSEIDPPEMKGQVNVNKIAEVLLVAAAKL